RLHAAIRARGSLERWRGERRDRRRGGVMNLAVALLTLLLLAVVILVISAPLRRRARRDRSEPEERSELEAARLAKYREIRDTVSGQETVSGQDEGRAVSVWNCQARGSTTRAP